MNGPTKNTILSWGKNKVGTWTYDARQAVWDQLIKYVRASPVFKKIKAAVNQVATIGIALAAIAILYYYN